jgi:voltage-gated potassium channel
MSESESTSWLKRFRGFYLPRRHTALLVAIVVFLGVRPLIGEARAATVVFSLALVALLIVALYTIQVDELVGERQKLLAERRRRTIVGWSLAGAALVERVLTLLWPTHALFVIGSFSYLLFFGFVAWQELRAVIRQRTITAETISMSISVYLLMGITWGLLYVVIYLRHPGAFSFPGSNVSPTEETLYPTLVYFSLTTLSTIGFGDITPVVMQARYAAVAEGITGQFYMAILVARLVGIYMSRQASGSESDP